MLNDDAKRFLRIAKYSARKKGFGEHADDLAQEVLLKFCEGRGQHQTIDQAITDAIRSEFGRPGTPGYELKQSIIKAEPLEVAGGIESDSEAGRDFERLVGLVKGRHRWLLKLYYEWGFSLIEIGDLLAVSESRASQMLTAALSAQKKSLQKKEPRNEARDRQCGEPHSLSLEVQKRPSVYQEAINGLEGVCNAEWERVVEAAKQEISKGLLRTFTVNAF